MIYSNGIYVGPPCHGYDYDYTSDDNGYPDENEENEEQEPIT